MQLLSNTGLLLRLCEIHRRSRWRRACRLLRSLAALGSRLLGRSGGVVEPSRRNLLRQDLNRRHDLVDGGPVVVRVVARHAEVPIEVAANLIGAVPPILTQAKTTLTMGD